MANKLIEGNFDEKIHTLKKWCDAFGNKVEPPDGYYLLKNEHERNDTVQLGDLHFDIYNGWVSGGEEWHAARGHYVQSEGRWRAWARKIKE